MRLIKLFEYELSEQRLETMALEFCGEVKFPAGNHQVAHVTFTPQENYTVFDLHQRFLSALQPFRKITP